MALRPVTSPNILLTFTASDHGISDNVSSEFSSSINRKYFIIAKKLITTHLEVFSREQLDAHDGEDEPEYDADHQHVEDAGDGLDECVHNDLEVKLLIELIC